MTDDLINRLVREAGGERVSASLVTFHNVDLQRFAALVAEECASQAIMLMRACLPQATAEEVARKDAYNHALDNAAEAILAKFKESPR